MLSSKYAIKLHYCQLHIHKVFWTQCIVICYQKEDPWGIAHIIGMAGQAVISLEAEVMYLR